MSAQLYPRKNEESQQDEFKIHTDFSFCFLSFAYPETTLVILDCCAGDSDLSIWEYLGFPMSQLCTEEMKVNSH